MEAKVGVITAGEVNMPVNGGPDGKWIDGTAPSTWATVVFLLSVFYLLKVL